jgi:hypothetical protein
MGLPFQLSIPSPVLPLKVSPIGTDLFAISTAPPLSRIPASCCWQCHCVLCTPKGARHRPLWFVLSSGQAADANFWGWRWQLCGLRSSANALLGAGPQEAGL